MNNVANTDFVQATTEIFGAITTLTLGILFVIFTGKKKKSETFLFLLLLITSCSLLVDAGWYIYDGNASTKGIIINWWCNFLIFLLTPLLAICANGYCGNIIKENGGKPNKKLISVSYFFATMESVKVFL